MATAGTLLDFGIAINFFGNYAREARSVDEVVNNLSNSLNNLKNLVIGGAITAALYKFSSSIYSMALGMEKNFAMLSSSLGSTAKTLETLEWARKKGAETPFEIEEVNNAVGLMTTLGFNKSTEQREKVFNAVGDFAGSKGAGFEETMSRVAKATFGNWMPLQMQYGISQQTVGGSVRDQIARTPDKFAKDLPEIEKAIKMVETGTKGTDAYKDAVIKLIGVLGDGGMRERLNTIGGAVGNLDDIFKNFMINMVGYTQIEGTLSNNIKNTVVGILDAFDKTSVDTAKYADGKMYASDMTKEFIKELTNEQRAFLDTNGYIIAQISAIDRLGRIGKGVGDILSAVWSIVDGAVGNVTSKILEWIESLDKWFSNFQENVAPVILFIAIIKIELAEFFSGFKQGFLDAFNAFKQAVSNFITSFSWLLDKLDEATGIVTYIKELFKSTSVESKDLGYWLGVALAAFLAFKAIGILASVFFAVTGAISATAVAIKSFTVAILTNPITLTIIAIMALIAIIDLCTTHWEDIKAAVLDFVDSVVAWWDDLMLDLSIAWWSFTYDLEKGWNDLWTSIKNFFIGIWNFIKSSIRSTFRFIKTVFVDPVINLFTNLWNFAKESAKSFVDFITDKFPFLIPVFESIKNIWESIFTVVKKVIDYIKDSWVFKQLASMIEGVKDIFSEDTPMEVSYKPTTTSTNDYYKKSSQTNYVERPVEEKTEYNFSIPQITINQLPGQTGQDMGNDFMQGLQQNLSRTGK